MLYLDAYLGELVDDGAERLPDPPYGRGRHYHGFQGETVIVEISRVCEEGSGGGGRGGGSQGRGG